MSGSESGSSFWGRHKEDSFIEENTREKEKEAGKKKQNTPATSASPDPDLYRLLSNFGISEPALSQLASNGLQAEVARGWILYLETQAFDRKQGYLVKRLRAGQVPPDPFLTLGQLTDDQLNVLRREANQRRWTSTWDLDELAQAGIDRKTAELWRKCHGNSDARTDKPQDDKENPARYTNGRYSEFIES